MNVPAAGVSITAEMSLTVDEDSGHSTVEDHGRAECFRTPREHDKMSRRQNRQHQDQSSGAQRELGERRASCHAADGNGQKSCGRVGLARNKVDTKDGHHARRSSDGDRRPQRPKSGFTRCDETSHKERVRSRKEKLGRRSEGSEYQREINVNIVDECDPGSAGSPTIRCSNTGDTDDEADRCSPINSESSGRQRLEASGTRNNATGKDEEKEEIERQSELHPTKLASDDIASDTTVEQERGIGTSGNAGVVVQGEAHRDEFTKRSRIFSSDNENVETIELSEGTRHNSVTQDHAKDGEQQQAGDHSPAGVRKGSNQDEDKEFDEDAEIDREVPQLEIENWGNPPPGQSATSRLHRHISQSSVEAGNLKVSVPPPKEFLTQGSLKPSVSEQHDMGRANANAGRHRDTEQTRSFDVPKPASNGRRRTAADLEWSDGAETPDVRLLTTCTIKFIQGSRTRRWRLSNKTCFVGNTPWTARTKYIGSIDSISMMHRVFSALLSLTCWLPLPQMMQRPRCVEENLTQPVTREPVDLGDSDEEGKDDLDLEVEKQRRRATAALVALEAAAKEADEGAQMESEALAKQKRKNKGGARGVVAKAYPSPAAPPPPALLRKARRAQGVPPPG